MGFDRQTRDSQFDQISLNAPKLITENHCYYAKKYFKGTTKIKLHMNILSEHRLKYQNISIEYNIKL